MTLELTAPALLQLLRAETAQAATALRASDLAAPARGLGRWKVRDIGAHLGGVHRWAARIVDTRSQDGPSFTKSKLEGSELCDWFDSGTKLLVDVFAANDAGDACPNFNPGSPKTVGWWLRRQVHETTIHRWDIERPFGEPAPIAAETAIDGIDEFFDVFVRTRGKQTLATPLVVSVDGYSWTLVPAAKPGRIEVTRGTTAAKASMVSGPADQVLLGLWNRVSVADANLTITGDDAAVASLFTQG